MPLNAFKAKVRVIGGGGDDALVLHRCSLFWFDLL